MEPVLDNEQVLQGILAKDNMICTSLTQVGGPGCDAGMANLPAFSMVAQVLGSMSVADFCPCSCAGKKQTPIILYNSKNNMYSDSGLQSYKKKLQSSVKKNKIKGKKKHFGDKNCCLFLLTSEISFW